MPLPCPTCRGRRHVPGLAGYSPCPDCYQATLAAARLDLIPEHMREATLAALPPSPAVDYLQKVLARLTARQFPRKFVLLTGPATPALLAATLRDYTLAGLRVDRVSFATALDAYFGDKPAWLALLAPTTDVLLVSVGTDILNTAATPVLRELITERLWKSAYTLLLCETPLAALARDKRVPQDFLAYLDSPEFTEVSTLPKKP